MKNFLSKKGKKAASIDYVFNELLRNTIQTRVQISSHIGRGDCGPNNNNNSNNNCEKQHQCNSITSTRCEGKHIFFVCIFHCWSNQTIITWWNIGKEPQDVPDPLGGLRCVSETNVEKRECHRGVKYSQTFDLTPPPILRNIFFVT